MGSGPLIMFNYKEITTVDLEISSLCNASCPDCPRNLRGYELDNPSYPLRALTLEQVQTLLPIDFLKQLKQFMIIGNHGDFVTCRDALKIVQYLYQSNPSMSIIISTNASGQPGIWAQLGLIPTLNIQFRIDGLEDTHNVYRRYTDYNLIIDNAKKYIAAGGYATWAMIEFDHNRHQIGACQHTADQLGFKKFWLVNSGRDRMPVFDRQGNFVRNIGQVDVDTTDINALIRNRQYIIDNHVIWHNEYKLRTPAREITCIAKQNKSIYIQVNGQVYPCCWTAFFPDTNVEVTGNDQIAELSKGNNAFEVGIEKAVDWFNALEQAWNIPKIINGRPFICNQTCGTKI